MQAARIIPDSPPKKPLPLVLISKSEEDLWYLEKMIPIYNGNSGENSP